LCIHKGDAYWMGDAKARAFVLALTQENEELREMLREKDQDLMEHEIKYVWLHSHGAGRLSLYVGRPENMRSISTTIWQYRTLEIVAGYHYEFALTNECSKFVVDYGLPSNTNSISLHSKNESVVCYSTVNGGFYIGFKVAGTKERYYVCTKTGFRIIRTIYRNCVADGYEVPVRLIDIHAEGTD
jgi:hypothetical protein